MRGTVNAMKRGSIPRTGASVIIIEMDPVKPFDYEFYQKGIEKLFTLE